jgi:N6-adenosine-specific RNA methylase IME4
MDTPGEASEERAMTALGSSSDLPQGHYGAILADPPWNFRTWSAKGQGRAPSYPTMSIEEIAALPVGSLAASDCALFLWATWPMMPQALRVIERWGFAFKTCAFCWLKVNADGSPFAGLGYWSRANTEPCLLATRGKPRRLHADVRQAVVAPRREHSRKPDGIHERIERLVGGPYLELFARETHPGWTAWGAEVGKFDLMEAAE